LRFTTSFVRKVDEQFLLEFVPKLNLNLSLNLPLRPVRKLPGGHGRVFSANRG